MYKIEKLLMIQYLVIIFIWMFIEE